MFKPLGIVIAVVMGVTYLGDTLYLGRYNSYISICLKYEYNFGYLDNELKIFRLLKHIS